MVYINGIGFDRINLLYAWLPYILKFCVLSSFDW